MESMREAWTDERLDYLNRRVDDGFKHVDQRFEQVEAQTDRRFDKVDAQLERVNDRIDAFHRTTYHVGAGIVVALLGIIATQL